MSLGAWFVQQTQLAKAGAVKYQPEKRKREFNTQKKNTGRPPGIRKGKNPATEKIRVTVRTKNRLNQLKLDNLCSINATYDEIIDTTITEFRNVKANKIPIGLQIRVLEVIDEWEVEANRWKEAYYNLEQASAKRITMLENELRSKEG